MRRSSILLLLFVLVISACSGGTDGQFGEELYESSCAACHRSDGSGRGSVPALDTASNAASLSDAQIAGVVKAGPGSMPSFQGKLSNEQIDSVVVYVRELQGSG